MAERGAETDRGPSALKAGAINRLSPSSDDFDTKESFNENKKWRYYKNDCCVRVNVCECARVCRSMFIRMGVCVWVWVYDLRRREREQRSVSQSDWECVHQVHSVNCPGNNGQFDCRDVINYEICHFKQKERLINFTIFRQNLKIFKWGQNSFEQKKKEKSLKRNRWISWLMFFPSEKLCLRFIWSFDLSWSN